jgi:hypothetical protein
MPPRVSYLGAGLAVALCAAGAGCEPADSESRPAAATYVDSALPREESLRRFRAGLTVVGDLRDGSASLEALARTFLRGLALHDTASLRRLAVTRGEYAWLIYPTDPQGLPPYSLAPGLRWFLLESGSEKGLREALRAFGGRPLHYLGVRCEGTGSVQGENVVWGPCLVRFAQARGDTTEQRLFGPVVHRGRQYKLLSFSNSL